MKKGLALEGGAMRGMFTCGVLDVFMENGIDFDGAAGISAGAVFGINFKSRQIGRSVRYNKKYSRDPRYCSFRSLFKTGDLYGVDFCYHELPDKLDIFDKKAFKENPIEFYIGATDIRTGRIVYHKCSDGEETDIKWMQASASMPLVSRPVDIGRYRLLDGGMVDAIPLKYLERKGYDRNVVVLTQPHGYIKKKSSALPMIKVMLREYPEAVKAMAVRHIRYNRTIEEIEAKEASGEIYVIRPSESLGIGRTEKNPDELERVYQMGRSEAMKCLEKVREFLA